MTEENLNQQHVDIGCRPTVSRLAKLDVLGVPGRISARAVAASGAGGEGDEGVALLQPYCPSPPPCIGLCIAVRSRLG